MIRQRRRRCSAHDNGPSAAELQRARHGDSISVGGLVICRQRPGTASGVVVITMEDETGF